MSSGPKKMYLALLVILTLVSLPLLDRTAGASALDTGRIGIVGYEEWA